MKSRMANERLNVAKPFLLFAGGLLKADETSHCD
jgi:hypothetical protein